MSFETSTPAVNVPLLRKMVEWVESQDALPPEEREWYQAMWFQQGPEWSCGTVYCVAGKLAIDAGWEPEWDPNGAARRVRRDGVLADVEVLGRELLGIAVRTPLFDGGNTAADVRRIAETIAGERL